MTATTAFSALPRMTLSGRTLARSLVLGTALVALAACGGRERPRADMAASQVTTVGANSYLCRAALARLGPFCAFPRVDQIDAFKLQHNFVLLVAHLVIADACPARFAAF